MPFEITERATQSKNQVCILITDAAGETSKIELSPNSSVFAGSGSNCRIRLSGGGMPDLQCRIWMDGQGGMHVQDWNTGKTFVNGHAIEEATSLNSGDELSVGNYSMIPVLATDSGGDESFEQTVSVDKKIPSAKIEASVSTETNVDLELDTLLPAANAIDSFLPEKFASKTDYFYDLDEQDDLVSSYDFDSQKLFDPETNDLELESLQIEVEQLRHEVAEREAQLSLLSERDRDSEGDTDEDEDTVRLVVRLEELLSELQTTDDRARGLEELLKFSDQATQAEQEERLQLEHWVGEIEQRVATREAESVAELERVLNRLKDAQARQAHAEAHLKKVIQAKNSESPDSSNELLEKFAEQVLDLQSQLASAREENETLQKQNSHDARADNALAELLQIEQQLLQAQVKSSRERAELARDREQLERLKDEFQQKLSSGRQMGEGEIRVQAMREHLQDIHQQEQQERETKKQRSLGGRISNLLNRVGR